MSSLDAAFSRLRELNRPVPKPPRLPSAAEVDATQASMGLLFPPDYRRFLMEASDVIVGTIEPATITNPQSHTHLPDIANSAWSLGVDRSWLPICEDNGDYFCLTPRGAIAYWSHNGPTGEQWPDLAAWIQDVWLAES